MERVDLTVVGGGPVGLFASFYAGLRGMSVRIVDSLDELGGQLMALYPEKYVFDMPGFPKVLARDLAAGLIDQGTQFQPEVVLERTAAEVRRDGEEGWTILTDKGEELPTRTIVISAGPGAFSPTKLGLENEAHFLGKGLSYGVKRKADFEGKRVVVVGGGDSAFDWCNNLFDIAESMTLVHRRDGFRAHEESIREARERGVRFELFEVVTELHGDERIEGVTLTNTQSKETRRLDCDSVIVNIGFKSSLGPLKTWGIEIVKNQIQVDDLYRTSQPGIFAVGDVCNFEGKLKLIATGVGEAATAVCIAKTMLDPDAKLFPGHSSDRDDLK